MKKIARLKLDKQVLRSLSTDELQGVGGGLYDQDSCAKTQAGSGCSSMALKCFYAR